MAEVQEQFEQATQQPQPKKANGWKRGFLIAVGGSSSDPPEPRAKNYTVGQKSQTVDMTWLVTDAYQAQELEDVYELDDPKRGNFVVVDFNFTNGADEAVTPDPTMHMELKDSRGRTLSTDDETFGYIPDQWDIFLEQVNPGVTQKGMVIFTVSPGASDFTFVADDVDLMEDAPAHYSLGF